MKKQATTKQEKNCIGIRKIIDETDIRVLVFWPPIIGFALLLLWMSIKKPAMDREIFQSLNYLVLGICSLFPSFSGVVEIYKREIPGPFGGVIGGRAAIVSGVVMVLMFGLGSAYFLFESLKGFLF
jgi:hypothetical protein